MKLLGYDIDELVEAAKEDMCYLFECGEGCGCFDNPTMHQDDAPQCPMCGSANLLYEDEDIERVMCEYENEGVYSNAMCEAKAEREQEEPNGSGV